ncbi:MAG TPA: hypothetical protein VF945_18345, partial [Polyangia bacterium]
RGDRGAGGARPRRPRARDAMRQLVAVAALVAAGCGGTMHAGATAATDRPIGEDLLALLPAGADAVVDVDVTQLDSWPTARRLLALMPAEGRARLQKLGDDPHAEINALVVAVYKVATPEAESVTVVRGSMGWDKLEATLAGGAAADYHGAALVDGESEALARITPTVFAFGTRAGVRRVCDVARKDDDGFRTAGLDQRLRDALGRAPTAKLGRPAIMAALVPTQPMRERLRAEKWDAAADLDWLGLSFAVGDGFDVGVVAGAHGPIEAATLQKTMKQRAGELKTQATVRLLGLVPFVEPFVVVAKDSEVHVAYRLTESRVNQLVTRLEEMQSLGRKKASQP